jgi:hypothetical protein
MDVGVNKPFRGYVREAYECFMIGNPENRKVRRRVSFSGYRLGGKE